MANRKTFSAKPTDVTRKWYEVDASTAPLGRLASFAAKLLIGKHKPNYTPHVDGGDYVIITNAKKLKITGNKLSGKVYYRHSGFPGGIKSRTLVERINREPELVIRDAVLGMLPKNKLAGERIKRLKIYPGEEHKNMPQKPEKVEVK